MYTNRDGDIITTQAAVLNRLVEHFKKLVGSGEINPNLQRARNRKSIELSSKQGRKMP